MTKTNTIRILEAANIPHSVHEYDVSDGKIDGVSVAAKCGRSPDMVFKTLVTTGKTTGLNVFAIPVEFELDLKKAAIAAGEKNIEMIKSKDLEPLTGYIHGGCSPIGMKKQFPTFIDETALLNEPICVSAGRIGLQVELAPQDLASVTGAAFRDLV
ncbi:MAG: Cys-tRNA(Pro) deacylase [Clostridiales bacterium]|jgi:Cys-tRNA(Pro)/Cys-tRNA(Cys) deacylase|nr:Cys-tRNA(Pro) deacylase [Clostridiales bacterium]